MICNTKLILNRNPFLSVEYSEKAFEGEKEKKVSQQRIKNMKVIASIESSRKWR
jgi:hypothetical protein